MTRLIILAALAVLLIHGSTAAHDLIPGPPQEQPIALIGGTVHPVSSEPLENAILLFDRGRIVAMGSDIVLPENCEKFDITGQHVYPAMFDSYSNMGLVEINAVRATRDMVETGLINPNVMAQRAVNPDSELIPVTRANGVLLALSTPSGGLITGQSAVLQLDGWTYEDMTLKPSAAMNISWPDMTPRQDSHDDHDHDAEKDDELTKRLNMLNDAFDDARAYLAAREHGDPPPNVDLRWEAMRPVLQRKVPLLVEAERVAQIQAAVAFANQQQVRLIIYGGYDAAECAELLKQNNVPVIVGGVYRLPLRRYEQYDAPYTLPARLHAAGVQFCISGSGRFGASNARNLPYHAATAAAYGLPREVALRSITMAPAGILGVANRVGSLQKGRDATLFVTTGDPLETASEVTHAWIQGRRVDLSSRHTKLYEKYLRKYE